MIQIMEFKDSCNKIGLPDEKLWLLNSCCYGGWPEVGFFSPILSISIAKVVDNYSIRLHTSSRANVKTG